MYKSIRSGLIMGLLIAAISWANGAKAADRAEGQPMELSASVNPFPVKPINLTRYDYLTRYLIENAYEKLRLNDEYQARVFLEKALEFNPSDPFLLGFVSYLYEKANYWGVAERYLSALVASEPDNAKSYLRRGYSRYRMRHIRGSILDLESALAIGMDPTSTVFAQRLLEEVNRLAIAMRRDVTDEWGEIQSRARAIEETGDLDALEKYYTGLAEEENYRSYALSSRGYLRLRRGETARAREDFEEALAAGNLDDASRLEIQSLVATIESEKDEEYEWTRIGAEVAELEEAGDLRALDDYLVRLGENERYRAYSLSSRGFLRLREGRIVEAQDFFNSVLALRDADAATAADAREALLRIQRENRGASEWAVIRAQTIRLERDGDERALEAFLNDLYNRPRYRLYALASRVEARLDRGDFLGALSNLNELYVARYKENIDWGLVLEIRNMAAGLQGDDSGWREVKRTVEILERGNLREALVDYLEDLSHRREYSLYACVSLAWMRLDAGDIKGGRTYLAAARGQVEEGSEIAAALEKAELFIRREADAASRLEVFRDRVDVLIRTRDLAGLRRFLNESAANVETAFFASMLRGYVNLYEGEFASADADFAVVLADPGLDYRIRDIIETTLWRNETRLRAEETWRQAQRKIDELKRAGDSRAEEDYYTELAEQREYRVFALYSRAHLRLAQGREREALSDFSRVLEQGGVEAAMRREILGIMARRDAQAYEQRLQSVREEAALVEAKDGLAGLEAYYAGLAETEEFRSYALAAHAQVLIRQGRLDEARKELDALRALAAETPAMRAELEAAVRSGEEALAMRVRVIELEEKKDWNALESLYTELIADKDQRATAYASRGYLKLGQGRTDEALADFSAALDDPAIEPAMRQELARVIGDISRGRALSEKWRAIRDRTLELDAAEDWERLERYFGELMADKEFRPHALAARAEVRLRRGDLAGAQSDFNALRALGEFDPAIRDEMESIVRRGEETIALRMKMAELEKNEDWPALEALYGEMIGKSEFRLLGYSSRGYLRLSQNRMDEALADFAAALDDPEIDPRLRRDIARIVGEIAAGRTLSGRWLAVRDRARELELAEDWARLDQYYSGLLVDSDLRAHALASRAEVRMRQGRFDEARADYRALRALADKDPVMREEYNRMARLGEEAVELRIRVLALEAKEDWAGLEALYAEMIGKEETRLLGYSSRGYLRLSRGRTDEALIDFAAALDDPAIDETMRRDLVRVVGEIAAARAVSDKWLAVGDRTRELRDAEDWAGLERYYTELLGDPDFRAHALASRAEVRVRRGRFEEARGDYRALRALGDKDPARREEYNRMARLGEEAMAMRIRVLDLEARNDFAALESLYGEMVAREDMRLLGYSSRGYLRLSQGRTDEALVDFAAALDDPAIDARMRADLVRIVGEIAAGRTLSGRWLAVRDRVREFEAAEDWARLDQYYSGLLEDRELRAHALASRAEVRMRQGRFDEARADYRALRALGDADPVMREEYNRMARLGEETIDVRIRALALETKEDWAGLEALYAGLIATEDLRLLGYSSRGYLRLSRGRTDEALIDFAAALDDPDIDESMRRDLIRVVGEIAAARAVSDKWLAVGDRTRELRDAEDWAGLEQYFTGLLGDADLRAHALASRAEVRVRLGKFDEARGDYRALRALGDKDPTMREEYNRMARLGEDAITMRLRMLDLEAKNDLAALEALYGEMIAREDMRLLGYSSRGYLRLSQDRRDEALADFAAALDDPDIEPRMRRDLAGIVGEIAAHRSESGKWLALREKARQLEEAEDWAGLERFYGEAMNDKTLRVHALISRAQVRLRRDALDQALADFIAVRALGEKDSTLREEYDRIAREGEEAVALRRKVLALEAKKDSAALEALYGDMIEKGDLRLMGYSSRGYLRLGQGRVEEALADFAAALDDPAIDPAMRRDLARAVGEIAAGKTESEKWLTIREKTREFEENEDWDGLIAYLTELAKDEQFRIHALASRAQVKIRMGRLEEAQEDFSLLRTMGGKNPTVRAGLESIARRGEEAIAYQRRMAELRAKEDVAGLEALYTEMAGKEDLRLLAYSSRGYLRLAQGRGDEALADFAVALNDGGIDSKMRRELARAVGDIAVARGEADQWRDIRSRIFELEKQGDDAELERYYTSLYGDDQFRVFALQNRGMLRFKHGRRKEAEADFAEALRLSRNDPERTREVEATLATARGELEMRDRIAALEAKNDTAALEALYTDMIERDDGHRTLGYLARGYLLLGLERVDEALGDFAQALRQSDLDAESRTAIVNTLAQLAMERKQAEEWLAVRTKARELEDKGDLDELEAFFTGLIDKKEFRAYALASRGWLRLHMDRPVEAEADFNAVLALADEDPEMQEEVRLTLRRLEEERNIRLTVAELEKAEDWEGIDRVYTTVIARGGVMRTYGYMMRGYFRYTRLKRYEALADFVEALRQPDMDPASRSNIVRILAAIADERRISEEWLAVRTKAIKLEWEGKLDELDQYYTELAETEQFRYFGLAARGYLRVRRGDVEAGWKDVETARAEAENLEEGSLVATAMLDRMEEEYQIDLVIAEMEERKDWDAIDAYYGRIAEERSDLRAFALSRRGYFRLGRAKEMPAIADFANALKLEEVDPAVRLTIVNTVSDIAENRRDDSSWLAVRARIRELVAAGDLVALENYYTDLALNRIFRPFALQERGLLRLRMGRIEEGNADIAEALSLADDYDLALREINVEKDRIEAMKRIQARVADFEAAGDWAGLDAYYTELSKQSEYRVFALSARGFLRLSLGRNDDAMGDFARVLSEKDVDPAMQRDLLATMVMMADTREHAGDWAVIHGRVAELENECDWAALAEYYGELLEQEPFRDFALHARGLLRLRTHRVAGAEADFAAVLESKTSTRQMRDDARDWLARIDAERNVRETAAELAAVGDMKKLEEYFTSLSTHAKYRAFALSSRAYLRLEQKRTEEAEQDFAAAMSDEPSDSILRRDIAAVTDRLTQGREWAEIQKKVKALEEAAQWYELEAYYNELALIDRYRALAYSGRGYLYYRLHRESEAEAEFARALALENLDPLIRRDILAFMAERETQRKQAAEWEEARLLATQLQEQDNYEELESLYTRLIDAQPDNAYAYSGRALARVALEKYDLAVSDLQAALANKDFDADSRKYAEEMLEDITTSLAAGKYPDNPRATNLLFKAGEMFRNNDAYGAGALLERVAALRLSDNQHGVLAYYQGEMLWLECNYDMAYQLYERASMLATDKMHLSDVYWKMADYHRMRGDMGGAVNYARLSHATYPENPWRIVQVGSLFYEYKMYDEAICYYELALQSATLPPNEIAFYGALANAYLMRNDKEMYGYYMERHIDLVECKINGHAATADDIEDLQNSRRAYAAATKRFRGDFYIFSTFMEHGDYVAENLNTLYYRLTRYNQPNIEAYVQTMGTLGASYSGTYYSQYTGTNTSYSGTANFFDTFRVAVGVRYNSPIGIGVSLDRVFGIGRDTRDDVRLKVDYYKGIGNEIHPFNCSWNYASFYTEGTYSIEHSDFTAFAEARFGRSFRADNISERLAVTPFIGVTSAYQGKDVASSERLTLEAGPGVILRHWNQGTRYKDPLAMYEMVVQYRLGLSHKRGNVLSVTLGHRF